MKKLLLLVAILFSTNTFAVEFKGKFLQGHFIIGITEPGSKIIIGKKEVKVSEDGYFVFGIDRDRKFDVTITKIFEGKKEKIIKKVLKRKYNIQRIDGLEESKVTPPESVYKRIKAENNRIGEARAINSELPFFKDQFIMPVKGIISGVYGSQRILNGKPRWPHYGIDIAAKKGTEIIEITPKYKFSYEKRLKNRYSDLSQYLGLNYRNIEADPVKNRDNYKEIKKFIPTKVLNESNYYKDLLIEMKLFSSLIKNLSN